MFISDLFSDYSDKDPDFNLKMYTKKRKGDLSDEEKEALGPKRKIVYLSQTEEPKPSTSQWFEEVLEEEGA